METFPLGLRSNIYCQAFEYLEIFIPDRSNFLVIILSVAPPPLAKINTSARSSLEDVQALSYHPSLIPIVDVIPLIIEATCRLNRQALTANFAYSGEIDVPLVVSTSVTTALVSAEDDGGASVNDSRCTSRRDSTCRSGRDFHPGGGLAPIACV